MQRGKTYRIVFKEHPKYEIYGTLEWSGRWNTKEEFKEFLDVCVNERTIEIFETEYEDLTEDTEQNEEDKEDYVEEEITELLNTMFIDNTVMFFSNIEHEKLPFELITCISDYEEEEESLFKLPRFSKDYFRFVKVPEPCFKNAEAEE